MNQKYKNLIKAVEKSGNIVSSYFGKSLKTQSKGVPLNFVTQADLESEKNLFKAIQKNFPRYNIISEEAGFINKKSDYTFVLDPLDGTLNLKIGLPYFSVTLALLNKDEVIFTVVNNPVIHQTFFAKKGKGAYLNNKRIKVNQITNFQNIIVAYTCGWKTPRARVRNVMKEMNSLGIKRVLTNWAPVFDFCLLASGKIEAIVCYNNELHDFIGGRLLIKEAGGKITDYRGNLTRNDRQSTFLATNGTKIHNQIVKILSQ